VVAPVFPDGGSKPPNSAPSKSKQVYSCDEKREFTDLKGVITFDDLDNDPNYIDAELLCDGVVDCKNWSDEDLDCSPSLVVVMIVFGCFALLFASVIFCGVIYLTIKREHGVVKAMGYLYLYLFSFFSIIGCLSVFLIFGQANDITCQLRIWVLALASAITIGTMSAKQYRVLRIFGNTSLRPVVVATAQLIPIIAAICVPDLVVLTLWTAAFTYKADVDGNHLTCSSIFDLGFLIIMFAYKGILLSGLSVMAFYTRHYPSKFSESTQLAIAIYNTFLIGIILVPVILAISEEWLQFIFAGIFILSVFFVPWVIICVPKIYMIFSGAVDKTSTFISPTHTPSKGTHTATS